MKLETLKFLFDIRASLDVLDEYQAAVTSVSAITSNTMLHDALQRRLSIIGEALWRADKLEKALPITDKQKIKGLRHILIHDYDKVNEETLFIVVTRHLDLLRQEIEAIIKANPPQGPMELDD